MTEQARKYPEAKGITFAQALFLVLLYLRLTHQIDWSLWWVTAPLWGGFIISVIDRVVWNLVEQKRLRRAATGR